MSPSRRPRNLVLAAAGLACLAVGLPSALAQNGLPSGGAPVPPPQVPLASGAGWSSTVAVPPAFFWGVGSFIPANDTFEFSGEGCFSITDDFNVGDRFRLRDNGAPLGLTSAPPAQGGAPEVGPDAAYADPAYSSGTFILGPGDHQITIEVTQNPFDGGRGYVRFDPLGTEPYCPAMPTLPGAGQAMLLALLLLGGVLALRRFGGAAARPR